MTEGVQLAPPVPDSRAHWLDLVRASVLADDSKVQSHVASPPAHAAHQNKVAAVSAALQHGILSPDQASKYLSELSSSGGLSASSVSRAVARREEVNRILESASQQGAFSEHAAPSSSLMQKLCFGTIFPLSQVRAILNNTPLDKASNADFGDKLEVVYTVSRLFELRAHSFHTSGSVHDVLTPDARRDCFDALLLQCFYAIDVGFDAASELPLELFIAYFDELLKNCGDSGVSISRPPKDLLAKFRRVALKKEQEAFKVAQKAAAKAPYSQRSREAPPPFRRYDRPSSEGELCRRYNTYSG